MIGRVPLRYRLMILFGIPVVLGVLASSLVIYNYSIQALSRHIESNLMSVAMTLAETIDRDKLEALASDEDPYFDLLKATLISFRNSFNLSWLAIYRYNGLFFTNVADGEEVEGGDGFCYDHPIMDIPDELMEAWNGNPTLIDAYEDAYGLWTSAFYPIKNADERVIAVIDVSRDMDEINQLKSNTLRRTLILAAVSLAVMLLICFFTATWVSRPLSKLAEAAGEITRGNFQARLTDLSSGREIDTVVQSFNTMSEALEKSRSLLERKLFELTTLFEISRKINFASSGLEIAREILGKAVHSLNASRGSILLYNEETDTLTVETAIGDGISEVSPRIEIKPGVGIAGMAFEKLEPVVLNSLPDDQFLPYDIGFEPDIHNILCDPLVSEGKAVGVINIINRKEGDFTEQDASLANTMCAQMTLAMEKTRMYELAITDGLTKLYVHRYFQLAMDNELSRCKRYKNRFSLILFDIDHFKVFNDTYGHQIGDLVLTATASLLKAAVRTMDIPCRYGGEEFTVILPETDSETAQAVAERFRKTIENHEFHGSEKPLKVTISIGISAYPEHGSEKMDLIRKADAALYSCKGRGRNCSLIWNEGLAK